MNKNKWQIIEEIYKTESQKTPCWLNVSNEFLDKTIVLKTILAEVEAEYNKLTPAQKLLSDFRFIMERQLTLFGYADPYKAMNELLNRRRGK